MAFVMLGSGFEVDPAPEHVVDRGCRREPGRKLPARCRRGPGRRSRPRSPGVGAWVGVRPCRRYCPVAATTARAPPTGRRLPTSSDTPDTARQRQWRGLGMTDTCRHEKTTLRTPDGAADRQPPTYQEFTSFPPQHADHHTTPGVSGRSLRQPCMTDLALRSSHTNRPRKFFLTGTGK